MNGAAILAVGYLLIQACTVTGVNAGVGCFVNGRAFGDGARIVSGASSQRCTDGGWVPRGFESCGYPLIAASSTGGRRPCVYADVSYPDGGLLNAGGVCQLCYGGIWIERGCGICASLSLIGNWRDGNGDVINVTASAATLIAKYRKSRRTVIGYYAGPSVVSFHFSKRCCTGLVSSDGKEIHWKETNTNWAKHGLTATPATVPLGSVVTANWTAPGGSSTTDWIGFYAVGAPNSPPIAWQYTGGATSGSFVITAASPGTYEFRYLLNGGYTDVARSNAVTVSTAGFTLTATPATVNPGGTMTVNWIAPAGRPTNDWVGLYKVGAPNSPSIAWQYTSGTTAGNFTVTAPAQSGLYEFRYLLNGGYTDVARSNTLTVP